MEAFLNGKTALVTGGSKGIGKATAQALLQAGARVAICGRDDAALTAAAEELKAHGQVLAQQCDVSQQEDVAKLFARIDAEFGRLDVLVNNAGVGVFRSVADLTPDEWRLTLRTNLDSAFYCAHEALPRLRAVGGGSIINISSLAGKNPFAGGSAYNASKFGLNGFSEALMLDHRNDGVRVCSVMPGSVDTEFGGGQQSAPWKIAPEDIAEIVISVLRMPQRTCVSRVEVRPSRPPQKG